MIRFIRFIISHRLLKTSKKIINWSPRRSKNAESCPTNYSEFDNLKLCVIFPNKWGFAINILSNLEGGQKRENDKQ